MRIFWLAVVCLIVGVIVGNRMAAEGSLPGCNNRPPAPAVSTK
jgi:hypothetical protein